MYSEPSFMLRPEIPLPSWSSTRRDNPSPVLLVPQAESHGAFRTPAVLAPARTLPDSCLIDGSFSRDLSRFALFVEPFRAGFPCQVDVLDSRRTGAWGGGNVEPHLLDSAAVPVSDAR